MKAIAHYLSQLRITIAIPILLLVCAALSCKKDETEDKQRENIERYITSSLSSLNSPRAEVDERDGVYYVPLQIDSALSERERIQVAAGDMVWFEYEARVMGGAIFATSDDAIAAANKIPSYNMGAITVGSGQVIAGLDRGLRRLSLHDEALLLFPYTLGYGEQQVGLVPPLSPLMFRVLITDIQKPK
ncbi:MAG: FKBP-type peptidyl-prolyl cis-trans isomerase [Prevotellaceae bacterium]|nr:FKBP-type peptidyl-prolyl cis-trans isomerase [Prevotellaceae bacterium]